MIKMFNFNELIPPTQSNKKEGHSPTSSSPLEPIPDTRFDILNSVMEQATFSAETKLLYSYLAAFVDFTPTLAPSVSDIATKLKVRLEVVCQSLDDLIDCGYLTLKKGVHQGEVKDYFQLNNDCRPCCFRQAVVPSKTIHSSTIEPPQENQDKKMDLRELFKRTEWLD